MFLSINIYIYVIDSSVDLDVLGLNNSVYGMKIWTIWTGDLFIEVKVFNRTSPTLLGWADNWKKNCTNVPYILLNNISQVLNTEFFFVLDRSSNQR